MDYQALADLLFPVLTETPETLEEKFPARNVPEGAVITRMAPSPTGFVHLGNLVQGMISERMAHQSEGVLFLRVEDTDAKREVPGAVEVLINTLKHYGIHFDDGGGNPSIDYLLQWTAVVGVWNNARFRFEPVEGTRAYRILSASKQKAGKMYALREGRMMLVPYDAEDESAWFTFAEVEKPKIESPKWEDETIFEENKERAVATYMPYASTEAMRADDRYELPWLDPTGARFMSLNGVWKLNYVENTDEPTLAGFLEEIALYTDIEQYDAGADAAVMMTIHSAKGLEFDHVFLVGFEDGLFPGLRSIGDPEEMEEVYRDTNEYAEGLKKLNIRDWLYIHNPGIAAVILRALGLLLLLPLFLISIIPTGLLFIIPKLFLKKLIKDQMFVSSFNIGVSAFITVPLSHPRSSCLI